MSPASRRTRPRRRRRLERRLAGLLLAVVLPVGIVSPPASPIGASQPRSVGTDPSGTPADGARRAPHDLYRPGFLPPLRRPVVDPFRAPATGWGPGNRGWEFASRPGDAVVAVGPGSVRFAGPVAGRGVVTVDHGRGLVSSLTGLAAVDLRVGDGVVAGTPVGTSGRALHLGFRLHGRYVDPADVFGPPDHAVLVPMPG